MIPKKTQSIIFDLGGVLYDIDTQRSVDAFASLGVKNFERLYSLKAQSLLFDEFEVGAITRREFATRINNYCGLALDQMAIEQAWNAMLLGIGHETIALLKKLARKYRIFLLSNTNEIHLDFINKEMQEKYKIADLSSLFEKAWFSHRIALRKPGIEIYQYVISEAKLDPGATVFIDDNKANVEGSIQVGLSGILAERNAPLTVNLAKCNL
jgi:FMN phosphatase YigB (HAD superfamily)